MKFLKKRKNKVLLEAGGGSPDDIFSFRIGRLAFAKDKLVVDISGYRRVAPDYPLGSLLSRLWWRSEFSPRAVLQIDQEFSPNFGGCFMVVQDCGAENAFGYVLAPSKTGVVGIDVTVPLRFLRWVGTSEWYSERLRLEGGKN